MAAKKIEQPAPTNQNERIVAYHPALDRHVVMPIGNLAVFNGWVETDLDPDADLPAEQGQPTVLPAVAGDTTVAIGDENKE